MNSAIKDIFDDLEMETLPSAPIVQVGTTATNHVQEDVLFEKPSEWFHRSRLLMSGLWSGKNSTSKKEP